MRLVWLDLNCSYSHSSLALPLIHAQGEAGYDWSVVSATTSNNIGAIVAQVIDSAPDVLAATTWLFNREVLLKITERVKSLLPNCRIVLGGPEWLGDNEDFLRTNSYVEAVFRGEGEGFFQKWLITGNSEGICTIDNDVYCDGGMARVADFAELTPPETSRFFNWGKAFVQIESARGCFNTCAFCVSGAEKPVRAISLEKLKERLDLVSSHGITEVRILDRTFNGSTRRAIAMLQLFEYYPCMRFHLEIHPALLNAELRASVALLPEGLLHLEAGIQSLYEPSLVASKRYGSLEDSLDGLRFLSSLSNVEVHADLIAGLPHYTLDQIYCDIATLSEMGVDEIQLELLKLLPGTAMRQFSGIIYARTPPYEVLSTDSITYDQLQCVRRLSRLLDMYYNTKAWRELMREMIALNLLVPFLEFMSVGEYLEQPLGIEKRGLLLYEFLLKNAVNLKSKLEFAWIAAGLTPRKLESTRKTISL